MAGSGKWTVECPCCAAELIVDAATGEVLAHRKPEEPVAGGKDFETLFAELDAGKERAEDRFRQEVSALKDRDRLLEEKFQEAMRRVDESDDETPPRRPFDLD